MFPFYSQMYLSSPPILLKKPALPPKCPLLNLDEIISFSVWESLSICSMPNDVWGYFELLSQIQFSFLILWYSQELWVYTVVLLNKKTRMHRILSHWCGHAVVWFQTVSQLQVVFQSMSEVLVCLIFLPCLGVCFQDYAWVAVSWSWACSVLSVTGIWSVIWITVPPA